MQKLHKECRDFFCFAFCCFLPAVFFVIVAVYYLQEQKDFYICNAGKYFSYFWGKNYPLSI